MTHKVILSLAPLFLLACSVEGHQAALEERLSPKIGNKAYICDWHSPVKVKPTGAQIWKGTHWTSIIVEEDMKQLDEDTDGNMVFRSDFLHQIIFDERTSYKPSAAEIFAAERARDSQSNDADITFSGWRVRCHGFEDAKVYIADEITLTNIL